jgi:DNA-binding transcriptional LysR family regulator
MDGKQLRAFTAAAEHLHFAHAARELGLSRATVVASVKDLEAELGYPLFDYNAPTTTLTDAGEKLLAQNRHERERSAAASRATVAAPGGKAKASKGKGRAPAVKGAQRGVRKRQGR